MVTAALQLSYLPHRLNGDYFSDEFMDAVDRVIKAAEMYDMFVQNKE